MSRRFLQRKEPGCTATILFRYSDCETSGFEDEDDDEHEADEDEVSISEFRFISSGVHPSIRSAESSLSGVGMSAVGLSLQSGLSSL